VPLKSGFENDTIRHPVMYDILSVCHCYPNVEEYRNLDIYVRGHSPFKFMHNLYITEICRSGAI